VKKRAFLKERKISQNKTFRPLTNEFKDDSKKH